VAREKPDGELREKTRKFFFWTDTSPRKIALPTLSHVKQSNPSFLFRRHIPEISLFR
jgi:hypothetical protein